MVARISCRKTSNLMLETLDLYKENTGFRCMHRVHAAVFSCVGGRRVPPAPLGRREDGAGGILKAKIGEEDRSTFVSLLSASRDKMSNH
tara:strand:+ start:13246 stop:13512 length:267 start_codon:yes stop_codon:yes gene_type:complete